MYTQTLMMEEVIMMQIVENTGKFSAKCICSNCRVPYHTKNRYDAKKSPVGDLCEKCKTAISNMGEVTGEKLRLAYNYNPTTGTLSHRNTTLSGLSSTSAINNHTNNGYACVTMNSKRYYAHRVIFTYMTGRTPDQVDHVNHDRTDNKWNNLREVGSRSNQMNMSVSRSSTTGVTGVSLHKLTNKYRAYITVDNVQIHLGVFNSIEEAKCARKVANSKYGFHNNHGC